MAARYLKSEGFEPVFFEQGEFIGGQWSGDPHQSGVWLGMRTNSSRMMTSFSDLSHGAGLPIYPAGPAIGDPSAKALLDALWTGKGLPGAVTLLTAARAAE